MGLRGYHRRDFLKTGGLLFGALASGIVPGLGTVSEARAENARRAKRIIYLWGDGGGPASADSFDPPKGSNQVDRIFPSIRTRMNGVEFTDQFPRLAGVADNMLLFRARYNADLNHPTAIAGTLRRDERSGRHLLTRAAEATPARRYVYAEMPNVINAFNYRLISFSVPLAAEARWDNDTKRFIPPQIVRPDPNIEPRWRLREQLQGLNSGRVGGPQVDQMEGHMREAYRMVVNAREASLDLDERDVRRYANDREPTPLTMGPLLARELVRKDIAGSVLVRMGHSSVYGGWDQHEHTERRTKEMAPQFDHAVAELIRDYLRGLLPDTLIVYDTEFGRTRKLNSNAGRDHYNWHTAFLVGEGMGRGVAIGETDRHSEGPAGGLRAGAVNNEDFAEIVAEAARREPDFAARARFPRGVFSPN